jgi:hypothetical protein
MCLPGPMSEAAGMPSRAALLPLPVPLRGAHQLVLSLPEGTARLTVVTAAPVDSCRSVRGAPTLPVSTTAGGGARAAPGCDAGRWPGRAHGQAMRGPRRRRGACATACATSMRGILTAGARCSPPAPPLPAHLGSGSWGRNQHRRCRPAARCHCPRHHRRTHAPAPPSGSAPRGLRPAGAQPPPRWARAPRLCVLW